MDTLFQYTSVNALESILKNCTIRLYPLDTMDDLQEEMSKDCKGFGNCVFCSSWSGEAKEMIPMWKMYGDNFQGVRIGLPADPFIKYHYTAEEAEKYLPNPNKIEISSYIPLHDVVNLNYMILHKAGESLLKKVKYVDDIDKLVPQLWKQIEEKDCLGNSHIMEYWNYGGLGIYKNKYWEFQKEYRYLLYLFPVGYPIFNLAIKIIQATGDVTMMKSILQDISHGEKRNILPYYDLKISYEALSKMEIVLGVKILETDRERVYSLVHSVNPKISIRESSLNGLLRLDKI